MEKKIKVAFQGEKGAYSHLAALEVFPEAEISGCSTFEELLN
jgi:Prephenate dehydratase